MPHGIVRIVVPGQFVAECQYHEGEYHGYMRTIFNNGCFLTGYRKNGQKYGRWTWHEADGTAFKECVYDSDEEEDSD